MERRRRWIVLCRRWIVVALPLVGLAQQPGSWRRTALHDLSRSHGPATWLARDKAFNPKDFDWDSKVQQAKDRLDKLERRRPGKKEDKKEDKKEEKKGTLTCDGKVWDSEVIYWRDIPSDLKRQEPTGYLSFEYDMGGWNNVRMGVECVVVAAHAMGRALVAPPAQNLYLLGQPDVDANGKKVRKKLGFADFFDLENLRSRLTILTMDDFLQVQTETKRPPPMNRTSLWGKDLWKYLNTAADVKPAWNGKVLRFTTNGSSDDLVRKYASGRTVAEYGDDEKRARHIHVPAGGKHRLLQHFYAFAFFETPEQRSFYRRFIRDGMRYRDPIQCAGAKLVAAVRQTSKHLGFHGEYYALHIRRGDFQFKQVKISAAKIVQNLRGNAIIPRNSLVYVATDDPRGVCDGCRSNGKPCPPLTGNNGDRPPGCPADPSWDAFWRNGWILVFSSNFTNPRSHNLLGGINPNYLGMMETIVCSRATAFAGTWFSTFTGYIHRLRGYHGLGEDTYYHTTDRVDAARSPASIGAGYQREWRIGWTDDAGGPLG